MYLLRSICFIFMFGTIVLPASAETLEFTDYTQFVAQSNPLSITTFDNFPTQTTLDNVTFDNFTIQSRRTAVINPQDFAPNLITGSTNVNSQQNGISASLFYNSSRALTFDNLDDNFKFILKTKANAAGLWIGNVGKSNNDPYTETIVRFFGAQGRLLASKRLSQSTEGMIGSGANNRIFYGIITDENIKSFTVKNERGDGDGIVLDDVQVAPIKFSSRLHGLWEGFGKQSSVANQQQWSIRFTAENDTYFIEYPSLACSGTWKLLSETSGSVTFFEDIDTGINNCINKGRVELLWLEHNKLRYTYYLPNGKIDAFGELTCSNCTTKPYCPL